MDRRLSMLLIGLIFGAGIGFTIAAGNGITLDGHDHVTGHGGAAHTQMEMMPLDLPAGSDAPTLSSQVVKDPMSGWNVKVETTNFRFAPEHSSLAHLAGEGHGHVYVDGVKIARIYGNWFHIDHLPEGEVIVEVSLNANDHRALSVEGTPLRVGVSVSN